MGGRQPMTRRVALAAVLIPIVIGLSGCDRDNSWDQYSSKSQVLRLFTIVPCDADVTALPEHQTYFHAWYFDPYSAEPGLYWIAYQITPDKSENGKFYVRYVDFIGLKYFTGVPIGTFRLDWRNCANRGLR
jgi:hypothetical protein